MTQKPIENKVHVINKDYFVLAPSLNASCVVTVNWEPLPTLSHTIMLCGPPAVRKLVYGTYKVTTVSQSTLHWTYFCVPRWEGTLAVFLVSKEDDAFPYGVLFLDQGAFQE